MKPGSVSAGGRIPNGCSALTHVPYVVCDVTKYVPYVVSYVVSSDGFRMWRVLSRLRLCHAVSHRKDTHWVFNFIPFNECMMIKRYKRPIALCSQGCDGFINFHLDLINVHVMWLG